MCCPHNCIANKHERERERKQRQAAEYSSLLKLITADPEVLESNKEGFAASYCHVSASFTSVFLSCELNTNDLHPWAVIVTLLQFSRFLSFSHVQFASAHCCTHTAVIQDTFPHIDPRSVRTHTFKKHSQAFVSSVPLVALRFTESTHQQLGSV